MPHRSPLPLEKKELALRYFCILYFQVIVWSHLHLSSKIVALHWSLLTAAITFCSAPFPSAFGTNIFLLCLVSSSSSLASGTVAYHLPLLLCHLHLLPFSLCPESWISPFSFHLATSMALLLPIAQAASQIQVPSVIPF